MLPKGVALLAVGALLAGLAYVAARETSLFALRAIDVEGASAPIAKQAEDALAAYVGKSLVSVDTGEVEARLEALPGVLSATVDRDFPHTLTVELRPERAVAVVRQGEEAWVVSARGRVMELVEPRSIPRRLPRIWLPREVVTPRPGVFLLPGEGGVVVRALSRVPADFPVRIVAARGTADALVLVLDRTKAELRLGDATDLRLKLAVAATVLESLGAQERAALAYLDVSLPTRPVGAPKAQVEA